MMTQPVIGFCKKKNRTDIFHSSSYVFSSSLLCTHITNVLSTKRDRIEGFIYFEKISVCARFCIEISLGDKEDGPIVTPNFC